MKLNNIEPASHRQKKGTHDTGETLIAKSRRDQPIPLKMEDLMATADEQINFSSDINLQEKDISMQSLLLQQ